MWGIAEARWWAPGGSYYHYPFFCEFEVFHNGNLEGRRKPINTKFPGGSKYSLAEFMWKLNEIIYRCSINLGSFHLLPETVLGQPAALQFTCQGPVAKVRGCI